MKVWVGPPGVGKSTRARAWLQTVDERTEVVSLADCSTEEDVLSRLHAVLRLGRPSSLRAPVLQHTLEDLAPMVILLDDVDACADVLAGRLPEAHGVQWLLTARRPIGPYPTEPVAPLQRKEARRLWQTLAPRSASDPALVDALIQLTDGLPLALVLAARRVRLLGLAGLVDRLQRSTAVLGGALHGAIAESVAGLSDDARVGIRALAVGPGAIPVDAAEALLEGTGSPLDTLEELYDAALLDTRPGPGEVRVLQSVRSHVPAPTATDASRWRDWCVATAKAWTSGTRPAQPEAAARSLLFYAQKCGTTEPSEVRLWLEGELARAELLFEAGELEQAQATTSGALDVARDLGSPAGTIAVHHLPIDANTPRISPEVAPPPPQSPGLPSLHRGQRPEHHISSSTVLRRSPITGRRGSRRCAATTFLQKLSLVL